MATSQQRIVNESFLADGGEMGALIRAHDWHASSLGPPERWPPPLRMAIRLMLNTKHPMYVFWGPEHICFYNDAYSRSLGAERHPSSLGRPGREVWAEIWHIIGPQIEQVLAGEGATWHENQLVPTTRNGVYQDVYWTYSYGPIDDEQSPSGVGGVLVVCTETTAQMLAQRHLASDAERHRLMFDQAPGFVIIMRGPDHIVEFSNAEHRRLFDSADWNGRGIRELRPELADEGFLDLLDRVYATGEPHRARAVPVRQRYGGSSTPEIRYLDFVYAPRIDREGRVVGIFCSGFDVTEERKVEEAGRISEAKYRALIEASSAAVWTTNAKGEVEEDSPTWRAFTGQSPDEILGSGWLNAVHPEDRESAVKLWSRAVSMQVPFDAEYRLFHADSARWPMTRVRAIPLRGEDGSIISWVGMNIDIEHRRLAERAIADSEARFRNMADHAPVMMWVTDPSGFCTYLNSAWYAFTGQSEREAEGFGWLEATHPDDRAETHRLFIESNAKRIAYRFEYRLRRHDGVYRWAIDAASPRFDADGEYLGYVGSVIDIDDRREMENRLRESESRFRLAADAVGHIVWIVDAKGRNEFFNQQWFAYTGAPLTPMSVADVASNYLHPDDIAKTVESFEQAQRSGRTFLVEHRIRSKQGEYRWFLVRGEPYRDEESGAVIRWYGTSVDIHDRKIAEAKLHESEERLRLAVDNAEVGFWDVDVVNDVLIWPPRVKAMFGISADVPVTMKDFFEGLHPADREATGAAFVAAIDPAQRALYDVEYRTIGKEDGIVRWVAAKGRGLFDESGRCVRVLGTAIDITARKAIEQELRELNETLEVRVQDRTAERNRVWSISRDLFAIMGFDGYLKAINPAWEKTLGFDEATLLSMDFAHQVHPEDHQLVRELIGRLRRGEAVDRFEDRLRHQDGTWRWISWSLVPEESGGDVFYAVGRDVTAEKLATRELERAQEALRQSQKMEAMGQLTGGVAHDFNNLLTPIVGSLDMLQRRRLGGEREQRLIAGAIQSAERAKTLVQRLLAFARRQPLQPMPVNVSKLIREMADLVSSTTGPQIKVVVDAPADVPPATADANQVEMALLNLAVNARDAMPSGGTLRFSVDAQEIRPYSFHAVSTKLPPGHYVRLSVADSGVGMDEETLARAIEPFFSTKGVGKGTGLGLSMVHGLASQLGGALTINSRPGLGTNVQLWLPQSAEVPETTENAPAGDATVHARGTALLVDDEDLVRQSTADMLTELGYSVVETTSAEHALELIKRGQHFDVLVTDHLMPGISGTELARAVRAIKPRVPVLLISGYAEAEGIDPDVPRLTKPFRTDELAASLAALE